MENQSNEIVTVYIPTSNRSHLLKRAVESVLCQTYTAVEIIIVDDHSDDDTKDVLEELTKTSDRIKYFRTDRHRGASFCRNLALAHATGFYCTGLDDDDVFQPRRIELFLKHYNSQYSFLCSNTNIILSKGQLQRTFRGLIPIERTLETNKVGNQIFCETQRIKLVGGYDTSFTACQDQDLWFRLILQFGAAYRVDEVTMDIYNDATYPRITTSDKAFIGYLRCYQKYKFLMNKSHRARRLIEIRKIQGKKLWGKALIVLIANGQLLSSIKLIIREHMDVLNIILMGKGKIFRLLRQLFA
ncbi:MAG: glycosyltransferase [Bacteroidetes bacterium]|nr:glycosyltransferase [Bacteroidota bacterium]